MGVSAYVHCRCWKDGLAPAPPVGPVGFDEDGRLGLLEPWSRETANAHGDVEHWLEHGCPHDHMQIRREEIGSWAGIRIFQQALRAAGAADFPVLLRYLPETNDGWIPADEVPRVLAELDHFENGARLADEVVLVDEASGDALHSYVAGHGGVFIWGRDLHIGVDPDGFFVLDRTTEPPGTLFRAACFEQRVLPGGELELTGEGHSVRLAMTPIANYLPTPPQRFTVQVRPRSAADFDHLLGMLRRLCAAALSTDNPIHWT
ncbi:hypothetical protein [Actinoplanes palleronii]|uniref:hypothetical protein n=1 Tax=Actinoplanes palleronii TaxID=113570 RepID=UPI0019418332|nr:hypothetical protein [Actinoplanes palleronii]